MRRLIIPMLLLSVLLLVHFLNPGSPPSSWYRVYGKVGLREELWCVCLAHDGGYVVGGMYALPWGPNIYPGNGIVMKLDRGGRVVWSENVGGRIISLWQTQRGYMASDAGSIYEFDEGGKLVRQLSLHPYEGVDLGVVAPTSDGGWIGGGYEFELPDTYKFDSSGNVEWERRLGLGNVTTAAEVSDGYLFGGRDIRRGCGYLLKLDRDGLLKWKVELSKEVCSVLQARDGDYVVGGWGSPNLFKLFPWDGRVEWSADLGGGYVNSIKQLENGDYLVLVGGPQILAEVDPEGRVVRTQYFRLGQFGGFRSMELTPDGGCILVGENFTWDPGPPWPGQDITFYTSGDYLVLKLGPDLAGPLVRAGENERGGEEGGGGTRHRWLPLLVACLASSALLAAALLLRRRREEVEWGPIEILKMTTVRGRPPLGV